MKEWICVWIYQIVFSFQAQITLGTFLIHMNLLNVYFFKIHLNNIYLYLGLPNSLILSGFLTKIVYTFISSPMLTTLHINPFLRGFMTLITSGKSSNCGALHGAREDKKQTRRSCFRVARMNWFSWSFVLDCVTWVLLGFSQSIKKNPAVTTLNLPRPSQFVTAIDTFHTL